MKETHPKVGRLTPKWGAMGLRGPGPCLLAAAWAAPGDCGLLRALSLKRNKDKVKHVQRWGPGHEAVRHHRVGQKTAEGCLAWKREGLASDHLFSIMCRLVKRKVN